MSNLTSKARRPKNAWFLFPSKVGEIYQIDIGYKSSRGVVGGYSSSPQGCSVKIPWGPPTKCVFGVRRSGDEIVREYKFTNRCHEKAAFDEAILKMLEGGMNDFARRVTSMCVQDKKILLGNFLSLVQFAKGFVHHRDLIHDEDGMMIDGSGVSLKDIEGNGGSLAEYRDFVKLVKESSREVLKTEDVYLKMVRSWADGRKKRKSDSAGGTEPAKKKSKSEVIEANEKLELEDSTGLEQKYMESIIGISSIPLDNLKVPSDLKSMVNIYRVYKIMASMKAKFDPSQTVLVVCPEDDSKPPNLKEVGIQRFLVIQKIHTFMAFHELNKKGEFTHLKGQGHANGKVLCYVLNTNSSALIHYGNVRSNEIANKFPRKTHPQDMLHIFESLLEKESRGGALKVVERMSRLSRLGPDETTAVRKLCQWSEEGFNRLMEVINRLEICETTDLKTSGNSMSTTECERLKMKNSVFNLLGKCEENYFMLMSGQVLGKEISLKTLAENHQTYMEIEKVYAVLAQISGFQSKQKLMSLYPEKFQISKMKSYIGAEIKGEPNDQAKLLAVYFQKVVKRDSENDDEPVKFQEIDSVKDFEGKFDILEEFDMLIVNLNKKAHPDFCLEVINRMIRSVQVMQAALMIFRMESQMFENLLCLRSNSFSEMEKFRIVPVYFNNLNSRVEGGFVENMAFGLLFGRFSVLVPPLKRGYSNISNVANVVRSICPPQGKVALVTDVGLPLIKLHNPDLDHQIVYFGTKDDISKFQLKISKDKTISTKSGKISTEESSNLEVDESSEAESVPDDDLNESSTSPAKSPGSRFDISQDSGIGSPESQAKPSSSPESQAKSSSIKSKSVKRKLSIEEKEN